MPQRRQEMQLLTNTLNSLNVEVPPNVLVPNGNTSFIDELSTFQGYLNQQSSAQQQMTVRPSNSSSTPPSGNNLTDLSNASPQIRGGYAPYKGYDGSLSGGQYPPNTTCEYGRNDLKMKLASVGTSTITRSNGQTPVNGVGGVNGINGGRSPLQQAPRTSPPQYGQYTSNYSYVNMQTKQDKNRSAIHGMDLQGFGQLDQPPPNVAITSPEVSLQALRALKVNRTQGSPTYPFMNSLSPTMSLNPYPQDVSSAQVAMYSSQGQYMTVPSTGHAQQMIGMRSYPAQYMQREQQAVIRDGRPTGWM